MREGRENATPQIDSFKRAVIELRRKTMTELRKKANEAKRCIIMQVYLGSVVLEKPIVFVKTDRWVT